MYLILKRDRTDTINSFNRWFGQLNHFPWVTDKIRHQFTSFGDMKHYDNCYPKFEIEDFKINSFQSFPSLLQAAEVYYDYYYSRINKLIKKFGPERIRQVDSYKILNDDDEKNEVLDWLGLSRPHRINDNLSSSFHQTNKTAVYKLKQKFQRG